MRSALPRLLAVLGLLLGMAGMCFAQSPPFPQTLNDHTVVGRVGSGSGSGPAQAIPFTTIGPLLLSTTTTAPVLPVVHPSSGNLQGNGCATAHQMWWVDQNLCSTADHYQFTSNDPSAIMQLTIGGSVTAGDRVTLTFKFGSGACASAGGGCAVGYTATNLDTLTTVAEQLACAIASSANLFTLNGATCTNGVLTAGSAGPYGGYASSSQIGYVIANATTVISLDFNATVSMGLTTAVSGSATETVTISNSSCGSTCSNALDGSPGFNIARFVSGIAPAAGSNIGAFQFNSNNSALLTGINTNYAQINAQITNSTSGATAGLLQFLTVDSSGNLSKGLDIGAGGYTVGTSDKGVDTWNTKAYWINSVYEIFQSSSTLRIDTLATNAPIVFSSGGGFGFSQSPTGVDVEVGTNLHVFGSAGVPTTGSGWTFDGGSPAQAFCFNWATSTYLGCKFFGSSYDFGPSGSSSTGVTIAANSVTPDANNATVLGSTGNRWSTVNSVLLNLSGTATLADTGTWGSSGIAGTTINSTAIGGTTPAAAKVTTLNASGQITSTTGLPTIASGACGATTNGAVVSGSTNQSGQITIGSAATTTCTISWSATLAVVPNACVFFPMNAAAAATGTTVARVGAPTNTQVVLTGSALANANYAYVCL